MSNVKLYAGDCIDVLKTIESQSVDAVITDPPYPCIKRDYGYWTVNEWWTLLVEGVVPEVRRILKPTGSAVFILQPNSEHVGQMRGWLWEFMAWVCREWNMVQDVYWWNICALPGCGIGDGLLRRSIKNCVWAGCPECFKNQVSVLWEQSDSMRAVSLSDRALKYYPSGAHLREGRIAKTVKKRGGVTPFNVLPIPNTNSVTSSGANGHGAGTPLKLADWWTRYIVPPGGVVCDPFVGAGTMGIAAVAHGHDFIGIDKEARYIEIAQRRIDEELAKARQLELVHGR